MEKNKDNWSFLDVFYWRRLLKSEGLIVERWMIGFIFRKSEWYEGSLIFNVVRKLIIVKYYDNIVKVL